MSKEYDVSGNPVTGITNTAFMTSADVSETASGSGGFGSTGV